MAWVKVTKAGGGQQIVLNTDHIVAIERYEVMQKAHARLRTRLTGKDGGSIEYDLAESPDDVLSKIARAETDCRLE